MIKKLINKLFKRPNLNVDTVRRIIDDSIAAHNCRHLEVIEDWTLFPHRVKAEFNCKLHKPMGEFIKSCEVCESRERIND